MTETTVDIGLYGLFRDYHPQARLSLKVKDGARIMDVRKALAEHARVHWPEFNEALLVRCAFASETNVLRDGDTIPAGVLAVLPPVAGG